MKENNSDTLSLSANLAGFRANSLSCERDDRVVFDQLSFGMHFGRAYQLVGPNGSGKSTLIRILCGLFTDFLGDLTWKNQPVNAERWDEIYPELLYIGHQNGVRLALTPEENLHYFLATHSQQPRCSIAEALAAVELSEYADLPCHQLSAGQQQRVSLARLYIERLACWVLDEPFTAIDQRGIAQLEAKISQHVNAGGLVVMTTHHTLKLNCELDIISLDHVV